VAGAAGALLPSEVGILLGFANLLADGVSMGASNFLAIRTEHEMAQQKHDFAAPFQHSLVTFLAFVGAGLVPILPYLLPSLESKQFFIATVLAAFMFFIVGTARTYITKGHSLKAGLEVLLIGGVASGIAYVVGWGIKTLFGIAI
jgi:VIT1/CCC1 family predicted Fe2+/Mn2+ transporter